MPGCAHDCCSEPVSRRAKHWHEPGEDKPSPLLCYEQVASSSIVGAMACPRPGAMLRAGGLVVHSRGDGLSSPWSADLALERRPRPEAHAKIVRAPRLLTPGRLPVV